MNALEIIGYVLLSIAILLGAALLLLIILILTTSITASAEYDGEMRLKVKYLFFTIIRSPETPSQIRKKKRKKKREKKKRIKELKKREKLRRKNRKAEHLKTSTKKTSSKPVAAPKKADADTSVPLSGGKPEGAEAQNPKPQGSQPRSPSQNIKSSKPRENKKAKTDLQTAVGLLNTAKPHIKELFKKIRITNVLIDILVGGEDAAKTAISYGIHCTAIYGLIEFLKQTATFEAERISIKADFDLPKTDYYAKGTVKLKISTFLRCILWFTGASAKELKKTNPGTGKQNNVKNQSLKKTG